MKPLIGPLGEKADQFESIVNIQDRMHRLKKFKKCFVGREAVDAMIHCGLSESRQQAVDLGRTLERELRLFKHVSKGHKFKDEYLFYRIVPRVATDSITSVKDTLHISSDGSGLSTSDEEEGVDGHASTHKVSSEILTGNVEKMVEMFRQCVDVRDRQDHFKKYKHCFVGCGKFQEAAVCFRLFVIFLLTFLLRRSRCPSRMRHGTKSKGRCRTWSKFGQRAAVVSTCHRRSRFL